MSTVFFLNNNQILLAEKGDEQYWIKIWDIRRATKITTLEVTFEPKNLLFSDHYIINFDGHDLHVLDLETGKEHSKYYENMIFDAIVRDGKIIAGLDDGELKTLKVDTLEQVSAVKSNMRLHSMDYWSNVAMLIASSEGSVVYHYTEGIIKQSPVRNSVLFVKKYKYKVVMLQLSNQYSIVIWDTLSDTITEHVEFCNTKIVNLYHPFAISGSKLLYVDNASLREYDLETGKKYVHNGVFSDVYSYDAK